MITKGTTFRAVIADCNALWEAKSKVGRGAWKCVVVNEPIMHNGRTFESDYAGSERIFATREIEASIRMGDFFEKSRKATVSFYDNLSLGSVVHYHNGFGQYVRCEVVMGVTAHSNGERVRCLKPVALVGNWKPYDLPRRNRDGSIYLGHHAKSIVEGSCFAPHASNIYESPEFERRANENPATMSVIDLSVPPMSPSEEAAAKLEALRVQVMEVLANGHDNPQVAMIKAKSMLANV